MVAPGLQPIATELYKDRNFIQKAVSIGAESLCSVGEIPLGRVAILYGEEAAIYCAPGNRRVGDRCIAGHFYIVGCEDTVLTSLSKEDIEFYRDLFWEPEEIDGLDAVASYLSSSLWANFFQKSSLGNNKILVDINGHE